MSNYTYTSVGAIVTIGTSPTQIEASRVSVSYGVNAIPIAQVELAVGALAGSGLVLSTAGSNRLGNREPITIRLVLSNNPKTIFSGYIASVSSQRSSVLGDSGRTGIVLTCEHWLSDLAASTAVSDERTPAAVFDFEKPVLFSDPVGAGTDAVCAYQLATALASGMTEGDLYSTIIKIIEGLANTSEAFEGQLVNSYAQDALDKIDGRLTFNSGLVDNPLFKRQVTEVAISAFMTAFNGGTLWSSLLACANEFRFAIIPTADKVFLVPSLRTMISSQIATALDGKDLSVETTNQSAKRAIRAVVLTADVYAPAGGLSAWLKVPIHVAHIGDNQGAVDVVPAPAWLQPATDPESITDTFDLGSGCRARGTPLSTPDVDVVQVVNAQNANRQDVADRWARSLYYDRYIGGDTATLITPVGYDIMPGICIGVVSTDLQSSGLSLLSGELYGYVQSVSISADAQSGQIIRRITLSHLRSEEEDANLTSGHPLFDSVPVSGTLVPGSVTQV